MSITFDVNSARLDGCSDGKGPKFIWLHALTSSRARERQRGIYDWTRLTDELTVIRFDARGHGKSSGEPDERHYVWKQLAIDLSDVLATYSQEHVAVGGASMGAATALWAALESPTNMRALVLATPPAAWGDRTLQAQGWRKAAHIIEKYGLADLHRRLAGSEAKAPPFFEGHPELLDTAYDVAEALLPAVLRGAAASDLPERESLASITVPTLVLAWPNDPDHPVKTAQAVADALPNSQLRIAADVSSAREWPHIVRKFLIQEMGVYDSELQG